MSAKVGGGGRILQIFQDVDMRQHFDGLEELVAKSKLSLRKLKEGEYIVFFNSRRTYLKLAAAHGVIASRRMEGGRFYDLSCIKLVVQAFHNSGEIAYERALKTRLVELLEKKLHARLVEED